MKHTRMAYLNKIRSIPSFDMRIIVAILYRDHYTDNKLTPDEIDFIERTVGLKHGQWPVLNHIGITTADFALEYFRRNASFVI